MTESSLVTELGNEPENERRQKTTKQPGHEDSCNDSLGGQTSPVLDIHSALIHFVPRSNISLSLQRQCGIERRSTNLGC